MIYVTGDLHGSIDYWKITNSCFPKQKTLTKNDYVIICGDFGLVWDLKKEERYLIGELSHRKFTTLFVDGNHENFDILNTFPVEFWHGGKIHKVSDSVYHLMRGQVFDIDGYRVFTMGGASSHDKICRKENISWWKEELPSYEEYEEAMSNLDSVGWNVDIVLSHCAPNSVQDKINSGFQYDQLTRFLQEIKDRLLYSKWFFGHYHVDEDVDEKHHCLYHKIVKVDI